MNTRCMIVDDEPLAREILEGYIDRVETLEAIATADSAERAFALLQKQDVDILFLDIEMPGMSGLGLLRALRRPPAVVLTTAHRDYAVDGYDFDVADFLLKPVSFERFLQAVQKCEARRQRPLRLVDETEDAGAPALLLRADRKTHRLPLDDILYVESSGDYVHVRMSDRVVTARLTMAEVEATLPPGRFRRIHRGIIVAVDRIDAFTSHSVEIGRHELTIGRNYRDTVLRALRADPDTP